jgi:type I restriction enzyme S subunit
MALSPEQEARVGIDTALEKAGWIIQDRDAANIRAARGIVVREFQLRQGYGSADYLIFVDGRAVGVIEAKRQGATLTGVEIQAEKYSVGLHGLVSAPIRPLPFLYQSTGVETRFTNSLDPAPRSREVFHFHRPETIRIIDYRGRTPPFSEKGIPHLRSSNIRNGNIIWKNLAYITEEIYERYMTRGLPQAGDVLFTTEAPLGRVALAPIERRFSVAQRMMILRSIDGVFSPLFLMYQLMSPRFQALITKRGTGTTVTGVSSRNFRPTPIIVAPLAEQHRIVEEIEKQFTRLDAAAAALKRVQANLKRYRASVLKDACEGKLVPTEAELARAEEREYESADKLLERILKERCAKWEVDQLTKMKAQGKTSKDDKWKEKYQNPVSSYRSNLPKLAEGWSWVSIEQLTIAGPQNGVYLPQSLYGSGMPILRIDDYQNNSSRLSEELRKVKASSEEIERYSLRAGDLVINRVNSPSHLGKCLVVTNRNLPALFESNMMRLQLSSLVNPVFVETYLRSVDGRQRLTANAKWAVNQASINQDDVNSTPAPIPPYAEQQRIVAEVERRLSVIDEIESTVEANLKRAAALRQSILKHAFEGKLVPQDPNDEPASALLERIRAERASRAAESKPAKPPRSKRKGQEGKQGQLPLVSKVAGIEGD